MQKTNFFTTQLLMVLLVIGVIGLGFNYYFRPFWNQASQNSEIDKALPRQATEPAGNLKNGLVASLSAKQMIAELLVVPILSDEAGQIPSETKTWLETYQPGFIQLRGVRASTRSAAVKPISFESAWKLSLNLSEITSKFVWPSIFVTNFVSPTENIRGGALVAPPTMASLCQNPGLVEPKLASSAAKLRQLGVSIVIGPVVDLNLTGSGLANLCNDEKKLLVGAQKYIENFGAQGILPILSHFPGTGKMAADPVKNPQTSAITVTDLKPFQQLLKMYPNLGVLVSPIRVAERFDGLPCSHSRECLASFPTDFPDVVVLAEGVNGLGARSRSDQKVQPTPAASGSGEVELNLSIPTQISIAESAKQSLLAGVNVLMFDETITTRELTEVIDQLAEWSSVDPNLNLAINSSWQKILKLRAGQNN